MNARRDQLLAYRMSAGGTCPNCTCRALGKIEQRIGPEGMEPLVMIQRCRSCSGVVILEPVSGRLWVTA